MEYVWNNEESRWVVSSSLDDDHAEHYEQAMMAECTAPMKLELLRSVAEWSMIISPWTDDDMLDTFQFISKL